MRISKPNMKTGIHSFNIHNKICRRIPICKKQECFKYCYYNKIIRIYPRQDSFLMENYKDTLKKSFVDEMNKQLSKMNIRYFRIHSCGEFYNQDYFNKWVRIASSNKEIIFYTYTRNTDLNVRRPKNLILYLSLSETNDHQKSQYKRFDGLTRIRFDKADPIPQGFVLCPHQAKGIKCIECKLCFKRKTNILFNKH